MHVAMFLALGQHIDIHDELRKDAVSIDSSIRIPTSTRSDSTISYGEDVCNANRNTEADSSESSENFDELEGRYSAVETALHTCKSVHHKMLIAK